MTFFITGYPESKGYQWPRGPPGRAYVYPYAYAYVYANANAYTHTTDF